VFGCVGSPLLVVRRVESRLNVPDLMVSVFAR
jgi:hypothetical protein